MFNFNNPEKQKIKNLIKEEQLAIESCNEDIDFCKRRISDEESTILRKQEIIKVLRDKLSKM